MTYFFETYGCQMNKAESAALELELVERGWSLAAAGDVADLVLINTCSVRVTAETRALSRISHYSVQKKDRPFTLIVAGCMAERLKDDIRKKYRGVDYVIGTASRGRFSPILDAIATGAQLVESDEAPAFSFSSSHLEAGEFRSFVPIMHGCNNFCSYCIVPYVRGREISRNPASILAEIEMLEAKGVREVTLLGQNVNSYHYVDGNTDVDFPALLRMVGEKVRSIRWLRFLSSHPKDLSDEAIQVLKDYPVFCRHLHLCVQHGSNRILSAMNRRYSRERYLELVDGLREAIPALSLSTDILIGFPGETEEDVEETLSLMDRVRFTYAYMYHYNPREGTAAFDLPNRIPDEVKKERLARVIALQQSHTAALMKARVGLRDEVLVEGFSPRNGAELIARTAQDEMVVFPGTSDLVGSFASVTLASLRGKTFRARDVAPCAGR